MKRRWETIDAWMKSRHGQLFIAGFCLDAGIDYLSDGRYVAAAIYLFLFGLNAIPVPDEIDRHSVDSHNTIP